MTLLIDHGQSAAQILTPGRYSAPESLAAQTLQEGLLRMTGVRLPIRALTQRVAGNPALMVGTGRPLADPALWERDSYEITPQGHDLLLAGSGRRGTHYAVHAFLESLGARFYWPDAERWPRLKQVALPRRAVRSTAAFSYRHVFYPLAQTPQWALRWKLNVHNGSDAAWGPNARAHSWGHSFAQLVPLEQHFQKHPEYYSLIDGQRRDRQTQLCGTNPHVADVASATMAQWIAAHPDRRIFAVGMNDWNGWCECPACRTVDRREGGPTGQLLTLVNRVAERFPDRIIATLAYSWAIDPPKRMRARDNVLIVLCHNEGCYTHALDKCVLNHQFLKRLRGWKDKSQRILIWDYFVNYHSYLMPTPNFRRIAADFALYRDLGIEAMFCQGSAVTGGQFEGLRQYLQARLLWNPDEKAWGIVEDWITGVYGPRAGAFVLDYLTMLEDHVHQHQVHMPSFGSTQERQPQIFTPEILQRGALLWDRAEKAAGDEPTLARVRAARAPEMCARLFHTGMHYAVRGGALRPTPAPDKALCRRFVAAALAGNASCLREDAAAPEAFALNYGRTYPVVILETPELRAVIVPEMGGRLYSLLHRASGLELMHKSDPAAKVNFLPYGAGYEFTAEPRWQGMGTRETYRVVEQGAAHAVLETDLDNGLQVRTAYALAGGTVQISHQLTNRGDQPVKVAPRTHPEFNYHAFGDAATARLRRGKTWQSLPLNPEPRPSRDLDFTGTNLPHGQWQVQSGIAALTLEETFAHAAVQETRLAFGGWGNLNLELHFKPRTLKPGATATYQTRWRID